MKRTLFIATILLTAIMLPACSSPIDTVQEQAAQVLEDASNLLRTENVQQVSLQDEKAEQPVQAPAATPGSPVVVLPSESAGVIAAYEGALIRIYDNVNPSVVNIRVMSRSSGMEFTIPQEGNPDIPGLPFNFGPFGNEPNQGPIPDTQPYSVGQGSGFIWDREGHIVTNNHVVEGAEKIEVVFWDETSASAEIVGTDPDSDLAVIKVDLPAVRLQPVQLADSNNIRVGELAIAIGNPYGLEGSMTVGIISAIGRTTPARERMGGAPTFSIPDVIQTDAPINPGNSGGVLIDDKGQVIGVTYMIESASGANAGIGFAIPSSIVSRVVPSLIETGTYQHPYLGISGNSLSPTIIEAMKLDPGQRGVLVGEITESGPAEKAGLRGSQETTTVDGLEIPIGGDVIIALNGNVVGSMDDLISLLSSSTTVGDQVTLTILRNGEELDIKVTLEARPAQPQSVSPQIQPRQASTRPWIGITAGSLTPNIAEAMDLPAGQTGVLIEQVAQGSPADEAGLRGSDEAATIDGQPVMIGGDIIVAIDDDAVESMEDLVLILQQYKPGDQATLTILRGGDKISVPLTLGERPAAN